MAYMMQIVELSLNLIDLDHTPSITHFSVSKKCTQQNNSNKLKLPATEVIYKFCKNTSKSLI